jgi:tetratricopeptide (TPR) repeat protein
VKHLDELLEARAKRDEAFAAAEKAEGAEKAKALVAALDAMGLEDAVVSAQYGDVITEIKASDPKDESGFVKKIEMNKKFAEFESSLNALAREGKHEEALKLTTGVIESGDFEGANLQQASMIKGMICAQMKDYDGAIAALDAAKAVDPESDLGGRVDAFKQRINQMKAAEEAKDSEKPDEAPAE